jgi:mono/diheme cytochrome c family protein
MEMRKSWVVAAVLALSAGSAQGAELASFSGKELYERFCSACHGVEGRGDGPVSKFFAKETPDLTLIERRHGGKYPYQQIEKIIDGRFVIGAHGSRTMPVWGEEFGRAELGNPDAEQATQTAIERLSNYLYSIQKRDAPENDSDSPPAAR